MAVRGAEAGFDPKCLSLEPGHQSIAPFCPWPASTIKPLTGDGDTNRGPHPQGTGNTGDNSDPVRTAPWNATGTPVREQLTLPRAPAQGAGSTAPLTRWPQL